MKVGDTEGVDLVDPKEGPISVKGPLGVSKAGDAVQIKQPMVDGLAKSVVKDVQFNTATKKVVVDLTGLSKQQQQQVIDAVTKQVGTNPTKEIQYLGRSD